MGASERKPEIFTRREVLQTSSLTALALATRVTPTFAQTESDERVKAQLRGVRSGERLVLADANIGVLARFPWEGKEADIAFITHGGTGEWLGGVIQADGIQRLFRDQGTLNPALFDIVGGIYLPNRRIQLIDTWDWIPEVFPFRPIIEAKSLTQDGVQYDCEEVQAKERLVNLVRKIDENLPDWTEGGVFRATRIALAVKDGVQRALREN